MRLQEMLSSLDRVLRGDGLGGGSATSGERPLWPRHLAAMALLLGGVYGFSLGAFGVFRGADQAWLQALVAALKVPALFVLTMVVTFPSLYVFATLRRLPMGLRATLKLLLTAIVVHTAVLAGLAPVFAFFAASTDSYPFMLLLNVVFFVIGGLFGLGTLQRAAMLAMPTNVVAPRPEGGEPGSAPPRSQHAPENQAHRLLTTWSLVYGVVGAQMAWLLRPFVGKPDLDFTLFRAREDNVFVGIVRVLKDLFS